MSKSLFPESQFSPFFFGVGTLATAKVDHCFQICDLTTDDATFSFKNQAACQRRGRAIDARVFILCVSDCQQRQLRWQGTSNSQKDSSLAAEQRTLIVKAHTHTQNDGGLQKMLLLHKGMKRSSECHGGQLVYILHCKSSVPPSWDDPWKVQQAVGSS